MQVKFTSREQFLKQVKDIKEWVVLVCECIERQLQEFDKNATFTVSNIQNLFLFTAKIYKESITFSLPEDQVKQLISKGDYSFDQYLWDKIQEYGIHFQLNSPYLKTVYGLA